MTDTRGTVAELLKQRTADLHERVETTLGLVDPGLDRARLQDVVTAFHSFWAGTEPQLELWFDTHADELPGLDWPRRRRTGRLARDLALLDGEPAPAAPPTFETVDAAAVLGWLYVTEGSSLGGAAISRRLATFDPPLALEFFAPYPEGPAGMWRSYHLIAAGWAGEDELRRQRIADAARTTFAALAERVAPLARETVA